MAGELQLAGLQRAGHVVLRLLAGRRGLLGQLERIGLELRRGGQPAHALGAHVVVDQRAVPGPGRRRRRDDLADIERLVAPLVGVGVEERGRVLLARRAAPVEREGERQPARLRPQLLLADVVRPAAARLADAAAHHQHVDDAAVVHVAVEPVVHRRADDDHRAALGLLGVAGELARGLDDLVARHAADLLGPGRRVGHVLVVGLGDVRAAEAAVDAVVGDEQVEHRGDQRLAVLQLHALGRHLAHQHARMVGAGEVVVLAVAEIGEGDVGELVLVGGEAQLQVGLAACRVSFSSRFHLPFSPQRKPTEPLRHHDALGGLVEGDRLPLGIVGLAEVVGEVGGAQQPVRHQAVALLHQAHQHRHVGVLAGVVLEILGLPVDVELAQDDVAHGHGERRVGALLHRDPQVGELGGFRVVRADDDALGALVADLGVEMGVRRARLRHVRAPEDQEARIVPVGAIPARRSARPRSAGRPAAGRSTSRRTTCTRRRAATDSASRRRSSPSTWPGSARSR